MRRKPLNDPEMLALGDNLPEPTLLHQSAPGVLSVGPDAFVKVHFHDMAAAILAVKQSSELVASYHASGATFADTEANKLRPERGKLARCCDYFKCLREKLIQVHEEHSCISGRLQDVVYFAFGPYSDKHNLRGISFRVSGNENERHAEVWFNLDLTIVANDWEDDK